VLIPRQDARGDNAAHHRGTTPSIRSHREQDVRNTILAALPPVLVGAALPPVLVGAVLPPHPFACASTPQGTTT